MKDTLFKSLRLMGKRLYIYLFAILLMAVFSALVGLISANLINSLYTIIENREFDKIKYVVSINVILGAVAILGNRYSMITYNKEAKRAIDNLQKIVYRKAIVLPLDFYETHKTGHFLSRLSYNVEKAGDVYGSRIRRVVTPIISVVVFLIPMFILNFKITLTLLIANTALLLLNMALNKPMKKVSKKLINGKAMETHSFLSMIKGIFVVKMFHIESTMLNKYENGLDRWKRTQQQKYFITATLESLHAGCDLLCSILCLGVGVVFLSNGEITLGALTAIFLLYSSFSFRFLQLGRYFPELIECLVYMQDLFDFVALDEEPNLIGDGTYIDENEKSDFVVEFENVTFGYNENSNVLENFSMKIENDKTTVITGESGSGKSTIIKLLLGLYEIKEGTIYLNGKDIKSIGYEKVRQMISFVPQDAYLYNVSILENISYGKENATMEEIVECAKIANAHDFIMKQKNGYDTIASESGLSLSGGERQRICIARAILKDAKIVVLDEATSALDNESELLIQSSIKQLNKTKTIIMIAHRPTTIQSADVQLCI